MAQLTAEQRSKIMASIHSKNTKPEMMVRRYLFACGFRYRVNCRRLPGTPDIVLRKYRTCIFVNGCFWHGHENCDKYRLPKTNVEFWSQKITRNKQRDVEVQHIWWIMSNLIACQRITQWQWQQKRYTGKPHNTYFYFTYFSISLLFLPFLAGCGIKPSVRPVFSVIAWKTEAA